MCTTVEISSCHYCNGQLGTQITIFISTDKVNLGPRDMILTSSERFITLGAFIREVVKYTTFCLGTREEGEW